MSKRFTPWLFAAIGLLLAGGIGLAYASKDISAGNLVFLELCTLTLGVVAAVFLKRMTHPPQSVEQLLYKTDHPTRM